METPSPQYILTRAAGLLVLLVVVAITYKFVKQRQRESVIIAELAAITTESSFFQQFYAEDARKSLIRAVGLIAEASSLGVAPNDAISRSLGIKPQMFTDDARHDEPPLRERIIRTCLRDNYVNFLKLGFKPDFYALDAMRQGKLPPIPSGPQSGHTPVISYFINPAVSPGMDRVIANLEIRPPASDDDKPSVVQLASAKQLARDLTEAKIIDDRTCENILEALGQKPATKPQ